MSYSATTMKTMGETNAKWGNCGFTSSLYAMYDKNRGARGMLVNAPQAWSVVYEIEEYLKALKRRNKTGRIKSIERFTKTFNGFSDFTVEKYLDYIQLKWGEAVNGSSDMNESIKNDPKFSIAMSPNGVADYLKRMWKVDATVKLGGSMEDGIVGVNDFSDKTMTLYGGLRHYLYQRHGKIYSWGKRFNSVTEAGDSVGRDYSVCYMITF